MNQTQKWKHYIPALVFFGLGIFFAIFPSFAAFLVILGLFFFAALYAFVIYRFHKLQTDAQVFYTAAQGPGADGGDPSYGFHGFQEPSFRNVSVYIYQNRNRFDDLKFGPK